MTSVPVEARLVRGWREHHAFCSLPFVLRAGDPAWVPPLRVEERRRWSARLNPSLEGRWVERFLVRRGGVIVGRIAAIEDTAFARRWMPGAGFFGFFECGDDREAAEALFEVAERALAARGCTACVGPVNLTTHDEVGLLIDGCERRPTLLSPHNPPRYRDLVEGSGYTALRDYHAYSGDASRPGSPALRRLERTVQRLARESGPTRIRAMDPLRWDEEVALLHELYNEAFTNVWGFVPISFAEFSQRAESFRPFFRPELVVVAEVDGVAAGFGLVLPDVNEVLATMRGRLFPFGWLRLLRRVPQIRTGRFILLGVRPAYVGRGVGPLIALRMRAATADLALAPIELSLVAADNQRMRRVVEAFGCEHSKTFRLYRKEIRR